MASSRTYGQLCPLARALDRVGERWTLLIVRDLAFGPKRYSDLLVALPGIGTTMLAERLRKLEREGIVARRDLPPPAASTVYELTAAGDQLVQAVLPLVVWGAQFLDDDNDEVEVRFEWVVLFWQSRLADVDLSGIDDLYEFFIDGAAFHVEIDKHGVRGLEGAAPRAADVVVRTSWRTLFDIGFGRVDPLAAVAAGDADIAGNADALERCYRLLGPEERSARPQTARRPTRRRR